MMLKMIATDNGLIDFEAMPGALARDNSLGTAVIVSLLTDRRAEADDVLPDSDNIQTPLPADRRGWAGDALNTRRIGSRLWLLTREKQTEETRARAIEYAREALQWLVEEGHARSVHVDAEWRAGARGRLDLSILIQLPKGGTFQTGVTYAL